MANDMYRKFDVIPLLIKVAQTNVKEKVIRVVVATFRVSLKGLVLCFESSSLTESRRTRTSGEFATDACCTVATVSQELMREKMV